MAEAKMPSPSLEESLAKLGRVLTQSGNVLRAQGAFGWVYQGNLVKARELLSDLPVDVLEQVVDAAGVLKDLAGEASSTMTQPLPAEYGSDVWLAQMAKVAAGPPMHSPDCGLVMGPHLTCTCGAFAREANSG